MRVKCISTGSQKGNCYTLTSESGQILILDFGCEWKKILRGIDYNVSNVVGCLLTHVHGDHSKAYKWLFENGIPIYTNDETAEHFEIISGEKMIGVAENIPFKIGEYTIVPFYVPHDGCPCTAFLIHHQESGYILYSTDMSRISQIDENYRVKKTDGKAVDWSFKTIRLSHMIIEANYDFNAFADIDDFKRSHVGLGHHSIQQCRRFVDENKTPDLRNVILCHLSRDNANPMEMQSQIQDVAGKFCNVAIAEAGMEPIRLSKYPW